MASREIREYWTPVRGRLDLLEFAPLVLAALYLDGIREPNVDVAGVLAVIEGGGWNLSTMEWGDLRAIAGEALAVYNMQPRNWRARAAGRLIPPCIGNPRVCLAAALAVSDDSLAQLVVRHHASMVEQ